VEFLVDATEEPTDLHVLATQPAGIFDQAALDAVKAWRFEPLVVDGVARPVPMRTVVRFAPPNR
jgi:protein TonB